MPVLNNINPSQLKIIQHQGSHLLIVAGPGTGKTHALTYRIAEMVQQLAPSQKILAITFTNKAAQEMRERLIGRIQDIDKVVLIGTFHQFCLFLLKKYMDETRLPRDFKIISEEEIKKISKEIWPELKTREIKDKLENISRWKATKFDQKEPQEVLMYNEHLEKRDFWILMICCVKQ